MSAIPIDAETLERLRGMSTQIRSFQQQIGALLVQEKLIHAQIEASAQAAVKMDGEFRSATRDAALAGGLAPKSVTIDLDAGILHGDEAKKDA